MSNSFKAEETSRLHSAAGRIERRIDALKRVDVQVDEQVCNFQQQHAGMSYSDALTRVLEANPELARQFNEQFGHKTKAAEHANIEDEDASSISAGKQLDQIALAWLREHPAEKDNYEKALQWAMDTHPDLAMLWKKSFLKAL